MAIRLDQMWPDILATVDRRISKEERPVPTPWGHVNRALAGGYWPGVHPVISTSGNGKSTFAMQAASHAAREGVPTFYASLELDNAQIGLRAASGLSKTVRWNDLLQGCAKDRDALDVVFRDHIVDLPLYIDVGEEDGWGVNALVAWIKEQRTQTQDTLFAVIDYLQLVHGPESQEMRASMSTIMKRLQNVARLHNVAILAISSTSRSNYNEDEILEKAALQGTTFGNTGRMLKRAIVMKMAKESGEIEYGSTSLSALIRDYEVDRTYLLIAKRRLDDGGVWCSFEWDNMGFVVGAANPNRPALNMVDLAELIASPLLRKSDPDDPNDWGGL